MRFLKVLADIEYENIRSINYVINRAVHSACQFGDANLLSDFLKIGHIKTTDAIGGYQSMLHLVAWCPTNKTQEILDIIDFYTSKCNMYKLIKEKDFDGKSPLYYAVEQLNEVAVAWLLTRDHTSIDNEYEFARELEQEYIHDMESGRDVYTNFTKLKCIITLMENYKHI